VALALAAHAQPVESRSYPFGSGVSSYGTEVVPQFENPN
jgi:hypothetical protein